MWQKIKNWFTNTLDLSGDGKVTAEDLEVARAIADKKIRAANEVINETVKETKRRVKRVKEEIADVKSAAKEVANQAGDVVDAAKGKSRSGRKKK